MLGGGKDGSARLIVRSTYRDVPGPVFIGERGPAQSGAGGRRVPYSHGHRVQLRRGVAGRQTGSRQKGQTSCGLRGGRALFTCSWLMLAVWLSESTTWKVAALKGVTQHHSLSQIQPCVA